MKVIGRTDDGYLISATDDEIAKLMGYYWPGEDGFTAALDAARGPHIAARGPSRGDLSGFEFSPDLAYEQLAWLRKRNERFDDLCSSLRKMADTIQAHRDVFDRTIQDS